MVGGTVGMFGRQDWWLMSTLLVSMLVVGGCSQPADSRLPVHPVEGKVIFENKPPTNAFIVFHPLNSEQEERPRAYVASDGSFRVSTYEAEDGAPVGEYAVTVQWYQKPVGVSDDDDAAAPVNKLSPKYSDPNQSPLRVQVVEGPNSIQPWTLVRYP